MFRHQMSLSLKVFVTKCLCHQMFVSPKIRHHMYGHQMFVTKCTRSTWIGTRSEKSAVIVFGLYNFLPTNSERGTLAKLKVSSVPPSLPLFLTSNLLNKICSWILQKLSTILVHKVITISPRCGDTVRWSLTGSSFESLSVLYLPLETFF